MTARRDEGAAATGSDDPQHPAISDRGDEHLAADGGQGRSDPRSPHRGHQHRFVLD
jgi:hypothetical protein